MKYSTQKKKHRYLLWLVPLFLLTTALAGVWVFNLLPEKAYTAADFGIETVLSGTDYNDNGIDDVSDLVLGARRDAENHPDYDASYVAGGYPAENKGVCADVIWRAFRQAGYSLKDMVDADVAERTDAYPTIDAPDPNIDFRRVRNLHVFFKAYAQELTCDTSDIAAWQPGDIIIFGADKHIGIISDRRTREGRPFIIHNGGQPMREEDYLKRNTSQITGHYRFSASLAEERGLVLLPWQEP